MRVLVAYASRHGATRGIAERIADTLVRAGYEATERRVDEPIEPGHYDAFVIGSAVYVGHWEKEATRFVHDNRAYLANRPVWLFSSGPLGTEEVDEKGESVRSEPAEIPKLREAVDVRGHHIFFGAYDPAKRPGGLVERLVRMMPASRDLLPSGDFRDWHEIEAWAGRIAGELTPIPAGSI
jgi:menaquinone-dependent protoporphyrinogen oxidase